LSGWEAIGGVFQLTRHWSGLPGGEQGEARVGLPPLTLAVRHLELHHRSAVLKRKAMQVGYAEEY
jgi:hypothetical protein